MNDIMNYINEDMRKELIGCYLLFTDILDDDKVNKWIESLDKNDIDRLISYKNSNPVIINNTEFNIEDYIFTI